MTGAAGRVPDLPVHPQQGRGGAGARWELALMLRGLTPIGDGRETVQLQHHTVTAVELV